MRDVIQVAAVITVTALMIIFAVGSTQLVFDEHERRRALREAALERARRAREAERTREQEEEAVRIWHARMRGRVHHPMKHPVSYATLDDLMPYVIDEGARA